MPEQTSANRLIRGGQTTQHWVRMASQVGGTALKASALVLIVVYIGLFVLNFTFQNIELVYIYYIADFMVEHRGTPDHILTLNLANGRQNYTAEEIYLSENVRSLVTHYEALAWDLFYWAGLPAILTAIGTSVIFFRSGSKLETDDHIRGTQLVSHDDLKKWSDLKWKEYRKRFGKNFKKGPVYTVAGIKFPPNAVEAQTAISGTVGVGKTNAIREILTTIREHDGRAIIYDRMGTYVSEFYDPKRDIILNPFDKRSHGWSPFYEANSQNFFTQVSEVLIPDTNSGTGDPFWTQAARIVFEYASRELWRSGNYSNQKLCDAILQMPIDELSALIERTPGRHFFNEDIAKTAGSIRASLITELRLLEFLRDTGEPFSIRDWVGTAESGFVFLTGDAEHSAATRGIISTVFEIAANALMVQEQADEPRVWFIMDEVPTLNRMPFLPKSLAEIRQFGGAFLLGYQVYSQLEEIYGEKAAQTIHGTLNNRIIFNTPDYRTADLFSESLGSEDVYERREGISVGAHETRDGVSFMSHRTERRIVTASQIQSLPQWQGYIRMAYDAPAAFVTFDVNAREKVAPAFIPYKPKPEDPDPKPPESDMPIPSPEELDDHFEGWRQRLLDDGLQIFERGCIHDDLLRSHFEEQWPLKRDITKISPPPLYDQSKPQEPTMDWSRYPEDVQRDPLSFASFSKGYFGE